ncbi:CPBP family intramembrane glutamic endopeptidase [Nocardiopsis sp. CC223A]|uniref:CPBP family intramembrane glutamic endopeptidase n=1 Tax=Nocardiopsis sp. CC223A TaxID=3044051 RepID=UPI00278C3338|nr:CPBP family intramembrane glutamic endopeptidase [Nocardiopsis sp. CC223A]
MWALTLLLVGVNEELVSRVVILRTLAGPFSSAWAVVFTAVLFGLQHLSQFAVTDRPAEEILWNVLLSAVAGFAYAAFQLRFSWLWPLILCHTAHDFTRIMAGQEAPDSWYAVVHVLLLAFGVLLLMDARRTDRLP